MPTRKGGQCGRRVTDGSSPAVCHIHRAKQSGVHTPLTKPVDLDELEIVRKLARSSDERIRLRAAELLIELKAKTEKPKAVADFTKFLKALLPDERTRLLDFLAQLRTLKEEVYERLPQLRPAGDVAPVEPVEPTPREPVQPPGLAESHPTPRVEDPDEVITVETLNHGPRDVTRRELEDSRV
jgi:hypothetical protein